MSKKLSDLCTKKYIYISVAQEIKRCVEFKSHFGLDSTVVKLPETASFNLRAVVVQVAKQMFSVNKAVMKTRVQIPLQHVVIVFTQQ